MAYEYLPEVTTRYIADEIIEAATDIKEAADREGADLSEELEYIKCAVAELERRSRKTNAARAEGGPAGGVTGPNLSRTIR